MKRNAFINTCLHPKRQAIRTCGCEYKRVTGGVGVGWRGGGISHFERKLTLAKDPEEKAGTIKVTGEMITNDISQNSTDDYHDISDLDSETQFNYLYFFCQTP